MTGAELQRARLALGLSLRELGEELAPPNGRPIDGRTLRRWIRGSKAIPPEVAERLADAQWRRAQSRPSR